MKTWYLVHKWTSLVCTSFLLLLCLTGLPLIFHHEIDHALGYSVEPPPLENADRRANLDRIVADAASRRPEDFLQFLVRDPDEPELWFVRLGETVDALEASAFFTYDARSGELLSEYPLGQGVMHVVFRLHYDLFAGLPGTLFLGFMGLLFLASLVSGTVLYGPYMRKLRFGTVRRRRSARVKWLDLHNLLGIVTLVWLFVVGATGVVNTLSIPIFGHWQSTQLAEMIARHDDGGPTPQGGGSVRGSVRGSVQGAVDAALAAAPGMQLSFLAFPGNGFAGPRHFVAFMQGSAPLTSKLLTPLLIDARTSEVLESRNLPWYAVALLVSQPLHFGDYGGLPLKILWALLSLLAILVLGSGLYLWFKRRHLSFEAWLAAQRTDDHEVASGAGSVKHADPLA